MKNIFLNNKITFIFAIILLGVFCFANSIFAVFLGPTSTPPNANISAPINVGPDFQTKTGLIAVNGFRVLGPAILDQGFRLTQGATNGYVLTSDADGNASWQAVPAQSGGNGWSNSTGLVYLIDANDSLSLGNGSAISSNGSRFINTPGIDNTFLGLNAGSSTVSGGQNTAVGTSALRLVTSGTNNTAFGYVSLGWNTTGSYNTAFGYSTMHDNASGSRNTALGTASLNNSVSGNDNTAIGGSAIYYGLGSGNTAAGISSSPFELNSTASNNTTVGAFSGIASGNFTNSTAIGAYVVATQSNEVRIGSPASTIDLQVVYTSPSDLRLKENINDSDLGLDFINRLRPVSYKLKGGNGIDYGFIAQEVETAIGKPTNIVLTENTEFGMKTLRYTDLIAPLTKAIQEQQQEIKTYRAKLESLKERAKVLEQELSN